MRFIKGVNMVNDLIRLDDEANFENIQQKFEWTRTSLVVSFSLLIGTLDSNFECLSFYKSYRIWLSLVTLNLMQD